MEKKKAIFINGSPRKDGNTAFLSDELEDLLKNDFDTEKIFLAEYDISPCK